MANDSSILTPLQRRALDWVADQPALPKQFYLSGGTALAEFYLHHRLSEDLDFFSTDEFDPGLVMPIAQQLKQALNGQSVQLEQRFNRNIIYLAAQSDSSSSFPSDTPLGSQGPPQGRSAGNEKVPKETLKLEFSWFIGVPIDEGARYHNLKIDSPRDIAVNKLFTIYQRPRSRDYLDLYLLMTERGYQLRELIDLARNKFDWHVDPLQLADHFLTIDLTDWPMLLKPVDEATVRNFFAGLARELEPEVLTDAD